MWSNLSARVAEVFVGLFVAGLMMGLLVPAVGASVGPVTALAIALLCVTGVVWVARIVRGRRALK